jgi:hypothetical protein
VAVRGGGGGVAAGATTAATTAIEISSFIQQRAQQKPNDLSSLTNGSAHHQRSSKGHSRREADVCAQTDPSDT